VDLAGEGLEFRGVDQSGGDFLLYVEGGLSFLLLTNLICYSTRWHLNCCTITRFEVGRAMNSQSNFKLYVRMY
jgi:hypothetical protein